MPSFAVEFWALPVLYEVRGEFGGELFQRASDVALWAEAERSDLAGLFHSHKHHPATDTPSELSVALEALTRVSVQPQTVIGADVSRACTMTAKWAENVGYAETALIFAQLAAISDPESAVPAVAAGKALRQAARYPQARRWFDRAISVARRSGDHRTMIEAYLGVGLLEERTGGQRRARKLFGKAYRAAKRHNFRELGAAAHQNAMGVCVQMRWDAEALGHAEAAVALYGPRHKTLPALAQDIAQMWSLQGVFDLALGLFLAALPLIRAEEARFVTRANIIRAEAGAGDRETFIRTWGELDQVDLGENQFTAEVLVGIGEGAVMLGLLPAARELGEQALAIARRRGNLFTVTEAEDLLRRVPDGIPAAIPKPASDRERSLAARLLRILSTAAPH